jgi:hypothetical protein
VDFSVFPKTNPYTRFHQPDDKGIFNPPAPPLELPQPPVLPLPEKDK